MYRLLVSADRILRQARRAVGLSQRALARSVSVHQPGLAAIESGAHDPSVGTLERALSGLGYRLIAVPSLRMSAADTADDVGKALRAGREDVAFRHLLQLNDDLLAEAPPLKVALTAAPPALTGDRRHDAFLAALVEHHLGSGGLPVPGWCNEPERTARPVWFVSDLPAFRADAYRTSPISFVRRGVFVNAADLASV